MSFFFFQAEDGIRDHCVTGVQTCALPIFRNAAILSFLMVLGAGAVSSRVGGPEQLPQPTPAPAPVQTPAPVAPRPAPTSRPVLLAPSGPKVRIGLGTDPVKVRVSADGGIVVRDPVKKQPVWKKKFDRGIYLVSEVSGGGKPGVIYRVQVASFVAKEQAETKKA